jgi:hypothetical protein
MTRRERGNKGMREKKKLKMVGTKEDAGNKRKERKINTARKKMGLLLRKKDAKKYRMKEN